MKTLIIILFLIAFTGCASNTTVPHTPNYDSYKAKQLDRSSYIMSGHRITRY